MEMKMSSVITEGIVGSIEDLLKVHGDDLNRIDHGVKGQFAINGAVVRYTFERVSEESDCEGIEVQVHVRSGASRQKL
jgi:hypothetical protein